MKALPALILLTLLASCTKDDAPELVAPTDIYFPPNTGESWEEVDPLQLGWNQEGLDALQSFVETSNTRALIILKNGRIAFESYQGMTLTNTPFEQGSYWYWASAGKTLTSFLVGRAEAEGSLLLSDQSNQYLGNGWTSLSQEQENNITVRHQLTMTTGLDDQQGDCTDPECLQFLADPGSRWSYHNAPYTRLDGVIEGATGVSFSNYFEQQLADKIGMQGFWLLNDYNNVFYSTPRSMARFGLLIMNGGIWDREDLLQNPSFFEAMLTTSQEINLSYGYLWWLNGKSTLMVPGLQTQFPTSLTTTAPAEMVAAMGKNGQLINIVPSEQLVVIRMGENPDNGLVPFTFQEELWEHLNEVFD